MSKAPEAFRTISEAAEIIGVPAHVLRFWESRFSQIKPLKRAGGRRYYRQGDLQLLQGIRRLLHDDGLTIRGVQKLLREEGVRHVAALAVQGEPGVQKAAMQEPGAPEPGGATEGAAARTPQAPPPSAPRQTADLFGLDAPFPAAGGEDAGATAEVAPEAPPAPHPEEAPIAEDVVADPAPEAQILHFTPRFTRSAHATDAGSTDSGNTGADNTGADNTGTHEQGPPSGPCPAGTVVHEAPAEVDAAPAESADLPASVAAPREDAGAPEAIEPAPSAEPPSDGIGEPSESQPPTASGSTQAETEMPSPTAAPALRFQRAAPRVSEPSPLDAGSATPEPDRTGSDGSPAPLVAAMKVEAPPEEVVPADDADGPAAPAPPEMQRIRSLVTDPATDKERARAAARRMRLARIPADPADDDPTFAAPVPDLARLPRDPARLRPIYRQLSRLRQRMGASASDTAGDQG